MTDETYRLRGSCGSCRCDTNECELRPKPPPPEPKRTPEQEARLAELIERAVRRGLPPETK